ncbi:Rab-like protein 3, partial [Coemansia aciculifera]
MNNASIRIGVLGEATVGKSELINRICRPIASAPSIANIQAGPTVDVLDFERSEGGGGNVWVEFLNIPSETRHPTSRQMLYSIGLDALILVCDCSVPRTFLHAAEWIEDAASTASLQGVPIAIVLDGSLAVDWKTNTIFSSLIDPLVASRNAQVIDL